MQLLSRYTTKRQLYLSVTISLIVPNSGTCVVPEGDLAALRETYIYMLTRLAGAAGEALADELQCWLCGNVYSMWAEKHVVCIHQCLLLLS